MQYRDTNYRVTNDGSIINIKLNKAITPVVKRNGYYEIRLSAKGKLKSLSHHRVVWEAWNGPIPAGMQINHVNGDKLDNRLINLEVVTPSENQLKRLNLKRGEEVNTCKLTVKDVLAIRRLAHINGNILAKEYGVSRSTINRIKSGKNWAHVK